MHARLLSLGKRVFLHLLLASCMISLWGISAQAATLTVNTNADSGPGSLRQAIANAASGDTINFDNDYTITLASQLEIVDKTVTVTGAGHHITISGNNAVRVFHVGQSGGSGNLTLDQLNIVNGASKVDECAGSAVSCGGGLMLEYLTTATVANSTFSNNDGGLSGGAIYSYYGNPLTVTNSTFTGNHATAYAGAIQLFYGSATLTNNTFTGNSAGAYGSALLNTWGTVTLRNNVFVKGATSVNACDSDFSDGGSTNDGGGNVRWGDATCPGANADPLLGTLGDYGGSTPTLPLLPGSPAINATGTNCPAVDARGIARGTTCSSGAFESQGFTLAITGGDNQSAHITTAFADPLALSVTSDFGEPVNGGSVTFTPPSSGASAAITDSPATISGGAASVTATANSMAGGPYNVTASATGASSVNFSLTNITSSTTTTAEPTTSTTTSEPTTTTTVEPTTTTTTAPGQTTTTTTAPACSVQIIPKNIGWFIGEKEKTRMLLVIAPKGSAFDESTKASWNSDAIETLKTWVLMKRLMLMKVNFDGAQLEKEDYTLSVDNCTGDIHMMR